MGYIGGFRYMNKVKLHRMDNNYTQADLCSILHTSTKIIGQIEKGNIKNVRYGLLLDISKLFNVPFEELFGGY